MLSWSSALTEAQALPENKTMRLSLYLYLRCCNCRLWCRRLLLNLVEVVSCNPYKTEVQRQEGANTTFFKIQGEHMRGQVPLWPAPRSSRPTLPCTCSRACSVQTNDPGRFAESPQPVAAICSTILQRVDIVLVVDRHIIQIMRLTRQIVTRKNWLIEFIFAYVC